MIDNERYYNLFIFYESQNCYWEKNQEVIYDHNAGRVPHSENKPMNVNELNNLKKFPCLFGYEDGGNVRIGEITSVEIIKESSAKVYVSYELLENYPYTPMKLCYKVLGLSSYKTNHSCWSLIKGDLYKGLFNVFCKKYLHHIPKNEVQMSKIWGSDHLKKTLVFITHQFEARELISTEIKSKLEDKNICCFLAHDNISPGDDWRNTIRQALDTCDYFVAVISTKGFHESFFINQEIGYAYKRNIPRLFISRDHSLNPKGFVESEQALKKNLRDIPSLIANWINKQASK